MKWAKEIWKMLKIANFKMGFIREDDLPPDDWFDDSLGDYVTGEPLSKEDVEKMIEENYKEIVSRISSSPSTTFSRAST